MKKRRRIGEQATERDIQNCIVDYLEKSKFMFVEINSGASALYGPRSLHGREGAPDIEVLLPECEDNGAGRVLWIEVKRPGGKLSKEQVRWHERAHDFGHEVLVVTDVDQVRERLCTEVPF